MANISTSTIVIYVKRKVKPGKLTLNNRQNIEKRVADLRQHADTRLALSR